MIAGVFFGVTACLIWGLVYIVPLILSAYDPALIAMARYVVFGALSAGIAIIQYRELRRFSRSDWICALKLGVIGNIFYYWLLSMTVRLAGAPVAGAFTAMIPVLVAIISNRQDQNKGRAVSWNRLLPPLGFIVLGMILANWTEFEYLVGTGIATGPHFWIGIAFAIASLLVWTWYPIKNAQWLISHPANSPRTWSTAQGLTLLPCSIIGLGVILWTSPSQENLFGPTPWLFLGFALVLGIVCSWVGIVFWNMMSQRLPPALGGQMIIFETVFAVIYAHMWRAQWPSLMLSLGMLSLLLGIVGALRAFR